MIVARGPYGEPADDHVASSLLVQVGAEFDQVLERWLARL